jgi:two-component system osmolarity sensor histidine kinase EnvZ
MFRLGLAARILFVLAASLVALQLVALAVVNLTVQGDDPGERFPLPAQVAAIVTLIESAPRFRAIIERAVEGPDTQITITATPPAPETVLSPVAADLLKRFEPALAGRDVSVVAHDDAARHWTRLGARWLYGLRPYSIAVRLSDGDTLLVRGRGRVPRRFVGLPVGVAAGWLGFVIAAIGLLIVWREVRPVGELAAAAEEFAETVEPQTVAPSGAPDVRRLIVSFNVMQERIASLVRSRTFMLGAMSHDLRTVAARLRLRMEALPAGEARNAALSDLGSMEALLENAMELARPAPAARDFAPVDIVALVGEECQSLTSAGRPVSFVVETGDEVSVRGDALAIRRAVINLIANAAQYAPHVWVHISAGGGMARIVVDDDGPGIPEADRERIFQPFLRLEPSRNRDSGGAGLGLAIVRKVADDHGGVASVAEAPTGGARFELALPLLNETAGAS